jgi:hypothetical protein
MVSKVFFHNFRQTDSLEGDVLDIAKGSSYDLCQICHDKKHKNLTFVHLTLHCSC